MLVMRRRAGESILIGDGIEIQVIEVSGTRVKLGISAPDQIKITRKEATLTRDQNIDAARDVTAVSIAALLERFRS